MHLRRPSYLSLLFSRTLHSVGFIFPFLPCLSLFFFPQLFVKPPETTTLPSCISFSVRWFWSLPPVQCYEPLSILLQALCLPDLILLVCSSLLLYGGLDGKEFACNAGALGSIPGSGRAPREGNGNPLQYSCLENSMDRGALWTTVHGVTKSRT